MISQIERLTIEAALRKMFSQGWFSISTVDQCAKVLDVPTGGKTYELLHALHCVHFADMDRELAEAVPGMIAEVLRGASFDIGAAMPRHARTTEATTEEAPKQRRGFLRILGK